jgi:alkylhydroperoxidase family enzyme
MAWIRQIPLQKATGLLKKLYDDAIKRSDRVWNITRVMSLNPEAMRDSRKFYRTIVYGKSPLTRVQRELLAVVVSKELNCHY